MEFLSLPWKATRTVTLIRIPNAFVFFTRKKSFLQIPKHRSTTQQPTKIFESPKRTFFLSQCVSGSRCGRKFYVGQMDFFTLHKTNNSRFFTSFFLEQCTRCALRKSQRSNDREIAIKKMFFNIFPFRSRVVKNISQLLESIDFGAFRAQVRITSRFHVSTEN